MAKTFRKQAVNPLQLLMGGGRALRGGAAAAGRGISTSAQTGLLRDVGALGSGAYNTARTVGGAAVRSPLFWRGAAGLGTDVALHDPDTQRGLDNLFNEYGHGVLGDHPVSGAMQHVPFGAVTATSLLAPGLRGMRNVVPRTVMGAPTPAALQNTTRAIGSLGTIPHALTNPYGLGLAGLGAYGAGVVNRGAEHHTADILEANNLQHGRAMDNNTGSMLDTRTGTRVPSNAELQQLDRAFGTPTTPGNTEARMNAVRQQLGQPTGQGETAPISMVPTPSAAGPGHTIVGPSHDLAHPTGKPGENTSWLTNLSKQWRGVPNWGKGLGIGAGAVGAGLLADSLLGGEEEDELGNKRSKRPWVGPLAGLATGLGGAYLMSGGHLGNLVNPEFWQGSGSHDFAASPPKTAAAMPMIMVPYKVKLAVLGDISAATEMKPPVSPLLPPQPEPPQPPPNVPPTQPTNMLPTQPSVPPATESRPTPPPPPTTGANISQPAVGPPAPEVTPLLAAAGRRTPPAYERPAPGGAPATTLETTIPPKEQLPPHVQHIAESILSREPNLSNPQEFARRGEQNLFNNIQRDHPDMPAPGIWDMVRSWWNNPANSVSRWLVVGGLTLGAIGLLRTMTGGTSGGFMGPLLGLGGLGLAAHQLGAFDSNSPLRQYISGAFGGGAGQINNSSGGTAPGNPAKGVVTGVRGAVTPPAGNAPGTPAAGTGLLGTEPITPAGPAITTAAAAMQDPNLSHSLVQGPNGLSLALPTLATLNTVESRRALASHLARLPVQLRQQIVTNTRGSLPPGYEQQFDNLIRDAERLMVPGQQSAAGPGGASTTPFPVSQQY